jgi:hypothetical protein
MNDKTKKTILFIGSLFAAIIFVSSYAAFGGNSSTSTTTTSIPLANTVLVYGTANGIIENYSFSAFIGITNKSEGNNLNNTLNRLSLNGNVSSFTLFNSTTYQAVLSGMNPYQLSIYLSNALNVSNVPVGGYAYVRLPATVDMYYGSGYEVPISFPVKNYSVYVPKAYPIGYTVPVKVQVLATGQGKIFNDQVRLTEAS